MRALLDVNVLIAVHDRDHVHHARAAHWLVGVLQDSTNHPRHAFWPDDISMLDAAQFHHPLSTDRARSPACTCSRWRSSMAAGW